MNYGFSYNWTLHGFSSFEMAGLHIDLQTKYGALSAKRDTDKAFTVAGQTASRLRVAGVDNYFVANAFDSEIFTYKEFRQYLYSIRSKNALNVHGDISSDVCAEPHDTVLTKTAASIADSTVAMTKLRSDGKKGIIATGIYHEACYMKSIIGLLQEGFHVAACVDATDCMPDKQDDFARGLSNIGEIIAPGFLSVIRTSDVALLV